MNSTPILLLALATLAPAAFAATPCESLQSITLPGNAKIRFAQKAVGGALLGPFTVPIAGIAPFCRVAGVTRPTADSDIKFEVWLPESGWNGKFRAAGNGGFAGSINYQDMAAALRDGFVTASTDTGHNDAAGAGWALGHPEKIIDFGYRAIHETAVTAKAIITAYYGDAPKKSYFASCSNGGRQALMEAQRYPDDYDGILAGAPANYWTHLVTVNFFATIVPILKDPVNFLPPGKIPAVSAAVLAACDASDGLKDGLVSDPASCHFDPAALVCKGPASDKCLTAPEAAELRRIYTGARDAQGQQIYPAYSPGGEDGPGGWPLWITGDAPGKSLGASFSYGFFRNMVFDNPTWDPLSANPAAAVQAADAKMAGALNATDPNLKPFQARGGKLILYHGWSDAAIPALNAIDYWHTVQASLGVADTASFARLYMVPGMQHCAGGPGPNLFGQIGLFKAGDPQHDIFSALQQWVENDAPPQQIIATKYKQDNPAKGAAMTRPICPYPQVAKYNGTGDANSAESFVCGNVP